MKLKTMVIIVLSLFIVEATFSQSKTKKITVSGFVTDVNETPLEGVGIITDGVSSNVFTNKKGFYKIKIKPDTKTLTAFDPNHGGIEVEFDGHTKINFKLLADTNNPHYINPTDEKLYNYGYGTISKKESSTGMASVDEKNMDNSSYKDIYDMIRGQVPGVSVIGSTIKIRGIRSVNGSSDPMFIVDGVESFSINDIIPSRVNSITVLKGTESAIYGSRGANGVIVITLKK